MKTKMTKTTTMQLLHGCFVVAGLAVVVVGEGIPEEGRSSFWLGCLVPPVDFALHSPVVD
jgi:hypothetical protein